MMFRKRQKKTFPPGTFISTPARVLAILQLCLAFSILAWNASLPFMGELFRVKSALLLAHDVMGTSPDLLSGTMADISKSKEDRLVRNAGRFRTLPAAGQQEIIALSERFQQGLQTTFLKKFEQSLNYLAFGIPPFEQLWLLLSLAVPILLLKKVEGSKIVVWLLPLATAFYAIDNRWHGTASGTYEERLFPSEAMLLDVYLKEPLSPDFMEQKNQLLDGWKRYLITEWAGMSQDENHELIDAHAEAGEFAFNIARLKAKALDGNIAITGSRNRMPQSQESLTMLAFYLFWNLLFALTARKSF